MKQKTILLVEDNADDEVLTLRAVKRSRVESQVVVARDGVEAVSLLLGGPETPASGPLPAVVLLDLKLPKLDGLEVLKVLRDSPRTHRLPVVILTSSNEECDLARAYDLGANSYVRKPVDFLALTAAVQQLQLYWLQLNEQPEAVA